VYILLDYASCVLNNFNFANNTDSDGYFWIGYKNRCVILRDSVVAFKATSSLKWLRAAGEGDSLIVQNSIVVAARAVASDPSVTLKSVSMTKSASPARRLPTTRGAIFRPRNSPISSPSPSRPSSPLSRFSLLLFPSI